MPLQVLPAETEKCSFCVNKNWLCKVICALFNISIVAGFKLVTGLKDTEELVREGQNEWSLRRF